MDTPLFTVIILSYHSGAYLEISLRSVLSQDYPFLEVIVSDDGTPDFDAAALEEFIRAHAGENLTGFMVLASQENQGTVASFNRAVKAAHGTYIKAIAADDALYDDAVLSQAAMAMKKSGAEILAARVMKCSRTMKPIGSIRDGFLHTLSVSTPRQIWRRLCIHNDLPAAGVFFSRSFFERYGPIDSRYRLLEDWPTWLRILRQGCTIGYGDFLAARYRCDSGCATSVNLAYLRDKELTFETEIRPYRKELGCLLYWISWFALQLRNSAVLRGIYGRICR